MSYRNKAIAAVAALPLVVSGAYVSSAAAAVSTAGGVKPAAAAKAKTKAAAKAKQKNVAKKIKRVVNSNGTLILCVGNPGTPVAGTTIVRQRGTNCPQPRARWTRVRGEELGVRGPQGPVGPQGPQGPQGPAGKNGIAALSSPVLAVAGNTATSATVFVINYDSSLVYEATAGSLSAAVGACPAAQDYLGCITVSGMTPGQIETLSVVATKTGAADSTASKIRVRAADVSNAPVATVGQIVPGATADTLKANFTWAKPTATPAPIVQYRWTVIAANGTWPLNGPSWTTVNDPNTLAAAQDNLAIGQYKFGVQANFGTVANPQWGETGVATFTTAVAPIVSAVSVVPGAANTAPGTAQVAVTSSNGAGGSSITVFTYQVLNAANKVVKEGTSATASFTITGLDAANNNQTVRVQATNAAGISSAPAQSTAFASAASGTLAAPTVTSPGAGQLQVAWAVPTNVVGGTVAKYDVTYGTDAALSGGTTTEKVDTLSKAVSVVASQTGYFAQVRAYTATDVLIATSPITTTAVPVAAGTPVAPSAILTAPIPGGGVNVSFDPLTSPSNGVDVTAGFYQARISAVGGWVEATTAVPGTPFGSRTQIVVNNATTGLPLNPATPYTMQVRWVSTAVVVPGTTVVGDWSVSFTTTTGPAA